MFFIFGLPMDSLVISLTSEISSEPKLKWALVLFLPSFVGFYYDDVQTNIIMYLFLVCFYYL
jgi:hypothetical protein